MDTIDQNNVDGEDATQDNTDPKIYLQPYPLVKLKPINHEKLLQDKWNLFAPGHNPRYVRLFENASRTDIERCSWIVYSTSQIGAVTWDPLEKAKLFDVLSRRGRYDLKVISSFVETKSQIEVKAYLDFLEQEDKDRRIFGDDLHSVTYADIPAAKEIGFKCEQELNRAADALLIIQEKYDNVLERPVEGLPRFIDEYEANRLDKESESLEDNLSDANKDVSTDHSKIASLFNLSKFLELSKNYFMHRGSGGEHQPWYEICQKNQTPTMTSAVLDGLYDLVINLTRRLVQTTLHVTESRLRKTTQKALPSLMDVSQADVSQALSLLNMAESFEQFWISVARRNQLEVVMDFDVDFEGFEWNLLSYDRVEEDLRARTRQNLARTKLRNHRRQVGIDIEADSDVDSGEDGSQAEGQSDAVQNSSDDPGNSEGNETDDSNVPEQEETVDPVQMSRSRRNEEILDNGLEMLDQTARQKEELKLYRVLEIDPPQDNEDKLIPDKKRVSKRSRDLFEDRVQWSATYEAEWEGFAGIVPADNFAAAQRPAKTLKYWNTWTKVDHQLQEDDQG